MHNPNFPNMWTVLLLTVAGSITRYGLSCPRGYLCLSIKKPHTFLLHCKLNFWDCPDLFQDGTIKVDYVLSYLKGSALDCFKTGLLNPVIPAWASDFNLFTKLKANFGTYDPISEAEAKLDGHWTLYAGKPLSYKKPHQIYAASHICSVGPSSTPLTGI